MKFIAFTEWDTTAVKELRQKTVKLQEDMKKFPDKYPKTIIYGHNLGTIGKAVGIYEAETEEQLINLTVYWLPEIKIKWIPLLEGSKVGEVWAKIKG